MKHSDFAIGKTFHTVTGPWRCTDIGSRAVVAISLKPRTMVSCTVGEDGTLTKEHYLSDDPVDLEGPPYGLVEVVFDEFDMQGCYTTSEEASDEKAPWPGFEGAQEPRGAQ